jgi:hypothetical protein
MKDCAYKPSGGMVIAMSKDSESESEPRYPSFSLYDKEAIAAVFGNQKLQAGKTMRVTAEFKISRITDTKDGPTDVTVEIVAVGGKPTEVAYEDDEEGDDEEGDSEEA